MSPRLFALLCLIGSVTPGSSEPKALPRLDDNGVPLPPGVIARIGSSPSISGKLLFEITDLPPTYRVDLEDEGKTLVVHPPRPDNIDRPVTQKGIVFGITVGRVWEYEHRFLPTPYYFGFDPGRVYLVKSAVRFRDWLLTFDDYGISRWEPATGKKLDECRLTQLRYGSGFAISADDKRIAVGEGNRFQISDGDLAAIDNSTDSHHWSTIRFVPDGRLASEANTGGFGSRAGGGRTYIWNVAKRSVEETIRIQTWPRVAEYHLLNIDPATTLPDHQGRPIALLDDRELIGELL